MITAQERAAMEETVRGAIAAAGDSDDVDAVLAELGWLDLLANEPDDAIEIVFAALGAANATPRALDDVLAAALGETPRPDLAVLLPPFATWAPPGKLEANELRAQGLATSRAADATEMLIVCGTVSEPYSAFVPTTAADLVPVRGVDPAFGLQTVRVRGRLSAAARPQSAAWARTLAAGRRAVGYQIAGACRTILELARTHALERTQFGRPIARFQAVRHRLAEVLVAVEGLEAALTAAREEPSPDTAALAKAVAGRTAHTTARHCQQVLAGIGFTTEHRFHCFMKRTMALEGLFGSGDEIVLDVGRRLLAERRVPTLIEL